jgi:hypothetical protein
MIVPVSPARWPPQWACRLQAMPTRSRILRGDAQAQPDAHGHVVVVVAGELNRGRYPTAFWGSLGGPTGENKTINNAWTPQDRDNVTYAAHTIP